MLLLSVSHFIYKFLVSINGGYSFMEIINEFINVVTAVGIFPTDGYCGD